MADLFIVPAVPTFARVERAWTALSTRRRRLVLAGATAAVALGVAAVSVAPASTSVALVVVGLLAAAAAVVDVHEHRLPNRLLTAAAVVVLVAAASEGWATTGDVAVSTLMATLPLWIVRYGKGLGLGDVKFAAVLGAAAGLVHPFAGLVVVWTAALASGVFALRTRRTRLALGPWLWAGFVVSGIVAIVAVHLVERMGVRPWPAPY